MIIRPQDLSACSLYELIIEDDWVLSLDEATGYELDEQRTKAGAIANI